METKLVIPSIVDVPTPAEFRRFCATGGTTVLEYDPARWKEYVSLLGGIEDEKKIQFQSDTIFRIEREDPLGFKEINRNLSSKIRERKIIFGTALDPNIGTGSENKFSMVVLPILRFMKFNKIYVMGFDGLPGRFYKKEEPQDSRTKHFVGKYYYLDIWKKQSSKINIEIINLNQKCPMSKIIGYKSIEEIL